MACTLLIRPTHTMGKRHTQKKKPDCHKESFEKKFTYKCVAYHKLELYINGLELTFTLRISTDLEVRQQSQI